MSAPPGGEGLGVGEPLLWIVGILTATKEQHMPDDSIADWQISVSADTSSLRNELQRTSLIGRQFSRSMISAFEGIAVQGRSLGDVVRNLGLSLSRMVLSAAMKPLDQAMGRLLGGIFAGGTGIGRDASSSPAAPTARRLWAWPTRS